MQASKWRPQALSAQTSDQTSARTRLRTKYADKIIFSTLTLYFPSPIIRIGLRTAIHDISTTWLRERWLTEIWLLDDWTAADDLLTHFPGNRKPGRICVSLSFRSVIQGIIFHKAIFLYNGVHLSSHMHPLQRTGMSRQARVSCSWPVRSRSFCLQLARFISLLNEVRLGGIFLCC